MVSFLFSLELTGIYQILSAAPESDFLPDLIWTSSRCNMQWALPGWCTLNKAQGSADLWDAFRMTEGMTQFGRSPLSSALVSTAPQL